MSNKYDQIWVDSQPCEMENGAKGWQGTVAFKVELYPPHDWVEMRWGFNAGALLEEALDRLQLFIETQHIIDTITGQELDEKRVLCLQCFSFPERPLLFTLLAKICAVSRDDAVEKARDYGRELISTFPSDYILIPLTSENEFFQRTNLNSFSSQGMIQLRRQETRIQTTGRTLSVVGRWQTSPRSHEQVWRTLSNMPVPCLLTILIHPVVLSAGEINFFEKIKQQTIDDDTVVRPGNRNISAYRTLINNYICDRLNVHKKFFRMQVILLTPENADENLARLVGLAFSRSLKNDMLSGVQTLTPDSPSRAENWMENLKKIDFMPDFSRVDDLADMDEVFSVFRLPYVQNEKNPIYKIFFLQNELDRK